MKPQASIKSDERCVWLKNKALSAFLIELNIMYKTGTVLYSRRCESSFKTVKLSGKGLLKSQNTKLFSFQTQKVEKAIFYTVYVFDSVARWSLFMFMWISFNCSSWKVLNNRFPESEVHFVAHLCEQSICVICSPFEFTSLDWMSVLIMGQP